MQSSESSNVFNEYVLIFLSLLIIVLVYVVNIDILKLFKVVSSYDENLISFEYEELKSSDDDRFYSELFNENVSVVDNNFLSERFEQIIISGELIDKYFFELKQNKNNERTIDSSDKQSPAKSHNTPQNKLKNKKKTSTKKQDKINNKNENQSNLKSDIQSYDFNNGILKFALIFSETGEILFKSSEDFKFTDKFKIYYELLILKYEKIKFSATFFILLIGCVVIDSKLNKRLRFIKGYITKPFYFKCSLYFLLFTVIFNITIFLWIVSLSFFLLVLSISITLCFIALWLTVNYGMSVPSKVDDL